MIQSLFIYQEPSGLLLYELTIHDVSQNKLEMFSSFFAAMNSMLREIIDKGSNDLKSIKLGDYDLFFVSVDEAKAKLVIITENEDIKVVNKIIPKIKKLLVSHKELFIDWVADVKEFRILDAPLKRIILSKRKQLVGELTEKEIHDFGIDSNRELHRQERSNLVKERETLINRLVRTKIIQKKIAFSKKILEIATNLSEEVLIEIYVGKLKELEQELKDTIYKANHYLNSFKKALKEALYALGNKSLIDGDYKDVYVNLYAFSTKLKTITNRQIYNKHYTLAKSLGNKDLLTIEEMSNLIAQLSEMQEEINDYIDIE